MVMNPVFKKPLILFTLMIFPTLGLAADKTLDVVKKRGFLKCGVSGGVVGFSAPDAKGEWKGLDVDVCEAMASAIFETKGKAKFVSLSAQQRFTALQSGEVDVLTRNTTITLARDTSMGLDFGPVNFYDGQGFMVNKKSKISGVKELNGATLCIQPGTTSELNAADYFRTHKMKFKPLVIESSEEIFKTFMAGRCDAFTSDTSQLAADRTKAPNPGDFVILPEIISKEPFAPAVRHGDDQWHDIVTWVVYAMIEAEELAITSKNVDEKLKDGDPRIQRLLGVIPGNGKALGLGEKWAYHVIKNVGNYSESFGRHVGSATPLKLERGYNKLWKEGGLLYSPPLR